MGGLEGVLERGLVGVFDDGFKGLLEGVERSQGMY